VIVNALVVFASLTVIAFPFALRDHRLVILSRWRLLFLTPAESWTGRNKNKENRDDDEPDVLHRKRSAVES
jgi:hypothetical protein